MIRVALYLRVSSKEQSIENQMPEIQEFCKAREFEIAAVYHENESAWHQGHQVDLERCKLAAQRREFTILVLWSLDRLSRGGPEAMFPLFSYFRAYGVKILTVKEQWLEQIDANMTPIFLSWLSWVAQMESQRRSERLRASFAVTKANGGLTRKGKRLGRPLGKKDGPEVKRKRSNYMKRWERERDLGTTETAK